MSEMENNHAERYEELLTGFVLGTLTRAELREIHALLEKGTPQGSPSVEEAHDLLASLPEALPLSRPSDKVQDRIMNRVRGTVVPFGPAKPSRMPALAWAAVLVFALLNVGLLFQLLRLQSRYNDMVRTNEGVKEEITLASASEEIASLRNELSQVKAELDRQSDMNEMLVNPSIQVANLKGTK